MDNSQLVLFVWVSTALELEGFLLAKYTPRNTKQAANILTVVNVSRPVAKA